MEDFALEGLIDNSPPLAILAGIAVLAKLSLGSWLAPAAFFPLFWFGLTAVSSLVVDYKIWTPALYWMDGTLFVFFLGSLFAKWFRKANENVEPSGGERL